MFWTLMADAVHGALAGAGSWLVAFAQTAAPVAVAALWQGAAIAMVLGLMLRVTSRFRIHMGAAQRFAVWTAAFAVVVGLQFLPWVARAGASAGNALPGAPAATPWLRIPSIQVDDRWAFAIAALWLLASLVRAASLAVHSLQLHRLWKSATPVAMDGDLRALLAAASPTRHPVELCTTGKLDRPSVIGFLAPRILIPEWLFARLTPGELEQVVLHEAEHLRRGDDWTNLLQKLALVLFPLNPALAWIEGRLCREREMACDEGVVRRTQAPCAYAECLTSLAERALERRSAQALALGAFERRPELVQRVTSILARKPALPPAMARVLVGVAGCGLLMASVELARCPQMVAFVPPAKAAAGTQLAKANAESQLRESDRAWVRPTTAHGNSGWHAVETKAIVPAGHGGAATEPDSRQAVSDPDGASQREMASANAGPREVLLRAEMPEADSVTAGEPQYVVLTAWEEVQTAPRHSRMVADYDTDTQAQSADGAEQTGGQTITRITVTRMIFAVYPINAAPSVKPAHAEDSHRPPAPVAQSGWLVFQL